MRRTIDIAFSSSYYDRSAVVQSSRGVEMHETVLGLTLYPILLWHSDV